MSALSGRFGRNEMKPVQYFSNEYLEQCRKMTSDQIISFLDEFRLLHSGVEERPSRLISIKVPDTLLRVFKAKAQMEEIRYQTQIKKLMREWVARSG